MTRSVIRSVGGFLPERVVSNHQLSTGLETSHEWIIERTGICQRHICSDKQNVSDLAYEAGKSALESADLTPLDIDLIIVATSTPDHVFPPCAIKVQELLGAHHAVSFDMNVACSGFLFAMTVADAYMQQGKFKKALIIGAEILSRLVDWEDRRTAVLFGDGAGAMVLEAMENQERGLLSSQLCTDGSGYASLYVCKETGHIQMNGQEVFRHAVQSLERLSKKLLDEMGYSGQKIDWVVPHQANKRIIDAVTQRMGISSDRVLYSGDMHANTSAASIPLALWREKGQGRMKEGDLVLFQAFGAGFSCGVLLARF